MFSILLALVPLCASAVMPKCSFAAPAIPNNFGGGCLCRFPNGTTTCVAKGPTGGSLNYMEPGSSPFGVYYLAATNNWAGMCTVWSGPADQPLLSGNTTLCPVAIGICEPRYNNVQCCYNKDCDACDRFLSCTAATTTSQTITKPTTSSTKSSITSSITSSTTDSGTSSTATPSESTASTQSSDSSSASSTTTLSSSSDASTASSEADKTSTDATVTASATVLTINLGLIAIAIATVGVSSN